MVDCPRCGIVNGLDHRCPPTYVQQLQAENARLREVLDTAAKMLYRLGRKLDGQDSWYDAKLRQEWIDLVNDIQPLRPAAPPATTEAPGDD